MGARNPFFGDRHVWCITSQSGSRCGCAVRRGRRRQYRSAFLHRTGAAPRLRRRSGRLYPRQRRAFLDAGGHGLHGVDGLKRPLRRHHHVVPGQRQSPGLFHRALYQQRRQVGVGQRELYGQQFHRLQHPGHRIRRRDHQFPESGGLPEPQFQYHLDGRLGQRADARRNGARQHRLDGLGRQNAGDAERRQGPGRPVERALQDQRRYLHLDHSVRQGRQCRRGQLQRELDRLDRLGCRKRNQHLHQLELVGQLHQFHMDAGQPQQVDRLRHRPRPGL